MIIDDRDNIITLFHTKIISYLLKIRNPYRTIIYFYI